MLIDTHCHLFYDDLKNDLPGVLDRAHGLGVNRFICVATNMEDARECLLMGESHENIFASVGIHPHDAKDAPEDFVDQIYDLMIFDSMVAVGEMGLDYFRNISDPEIQKNILPRVKRPTNRKISNEIESIGGDFNAYTTKKEPFTYI